MISRNRLNPNHDLRLEFDIGGFEARYHGKFPNGSRLREEALRLGWPLVFPCGGKGECGECRVRVIEHREGAGAKASGKSGAKKRPRRDYAQAELFHLPAELREEGEWRLACCLRVECDMTIVRPAPPADLIEGLAAVRDELTPDELLDAE